MKKLINELCDNYIKNFDSKIYGSHNGPYNDCETPVRLLAHRIVFLCEYSKVHKINDYDELIRSLANEMLQRKYRPDGYTFICRTSPNKDKTNGVIGQAWVIEALVALYEELKHEQYIDLAKKIFLLHPMDYEQGVWHRVDISGEKMSCDMTFNHQLWFAASGSFVNSFIKDNEVKKNIDCFVEHLPQNCNIYDNGLIKHRIEPIDIKNKFIYVLKDYRENIRNFFRKPSMYYKEIGYHSFNLYGFAFLRQFYGNVSFFNNNKFRKAISFVNSEEYEKALSSVNHSLDINAPNLNSCSLKCNRYGYGYNVSGFEIAYVYKIFPDLGISEQVVKALLEKQIKYEFASYADFNIALEIEDPVIVRARTYELVRAL